MERHYPKIGYYLIPKNFISSGKNIRKIHTIWYEMVWHEIIPFFSFHTTLERGSYAMHLVSYHRNDFIPKLNKSYHTNGHSH